MTADRTIQLALQGYDLLPTLRRGAGTDVFDIRLFGVPVTCMTGPAAAEVFYDPERFERRTAVPGRVQKTLFGEGGVQGLDDAPHRNRKSLFAALMTPDGISSLVSGVASEWAAAVDGWSRRDSVVLFDEASRVLTRAACAWAGAPLPAVGAATTAANLVATVDSFGAVGARHWRGRLARQRLERWTRKVVADVRAGALPTPAGAAASVVAGHRDVDGRPLTTRVAAVELLNVIRPLVAICWYVAFAGHALHQHHAWRTRIQSDGDELVESFVHEVRRYYPFAPFLGAAVRRHFTWQGHEFPAGRLVLLDVYGMNHDPRWWPNPQVFDPERFVARDFGAYDFIPQGGGDPDTGHRCPGERITIELVKQAVRLLVRLDYDVPPQDLSIPLDRIPTRPRSGVLLRRTPVLDRTAVAPAGRGIS